MKIVKVMVMDYDPKTTALNYRVSCDEFTEEMTLMGSEISFSSDISEKLKERSKAFFEALNEAFFEFCESDSNRDKLGFDFYFNGN